MQSEWIMSAVMEYFCDILVDHDISDDFVDHLDALFVLVCLKLIEVNQKSVVRVVELHHFDEPTLSQGAF